MSEKIRNNRRLSALRTVAAALGFAAISAAGFAQGTVSGYVFAQSSGTYTTLTGATVLATGLSDDESYTIDLVSMSPAFDFSFAGERVRNLAVTSNGHVRFRGRGQHDSYNPIAGAGAENNWVACVFSRDSQGNTTLGSEIRYLVTGTAPTRTLTVEWTNRQRFGGVAAETWTYQLQMDETTGVMRMVYGTFSGSPSSITGQVGLEGFTNTAGNFLTRTTTTDWAATTAGTAAQTCTVSGTVFPASGLTYTWTPTTAAAPGAPTLLYPAAGATSVPQNVALLWDSPTAGVNSPTAYFLDFETTDPPTNNISTGSANQFDPAGLMTAATAYFFKARSSNAGGTSADSAQRTFTTDSPIAAFPYTQNFATYPVALNTAGSWQEGRAVPSANTQFLDFPRPDGTYPSGGTVLGAWQADGFANSGGTGAARLALVNNNMREWLMTPIFDIGTGTEYRLRFDVALTTNAGTAASTIQAGDSYLVLKSADGGATWNVADTLMTFNNSTPISNTGQTVTINLGAEDGLVQFAFVGLSGQTARTASAPDFFIDNVIVEPVPLVADLSATSFSANFNNQFGGRNVTYTVAISNTGGAASTGTTLNVPIQPGFSYVTGSASVNTTPAFATGTLTDTGGVIDLTATNIPSGGTVTVSWQYRSDNTTGTATTTASINDPSLGTPITRNLLHTFRPNLPVAAGADIFYDVWDTFQGSPNSPTFSYETPTGTALTFADDDNIVEINSGTTPALPSWPISYYGQTVTNLTIDNDGFLIVNLPGTNASFTNADLNLAGTQNNIIAPWWDDQDDAPSNIRVFETGVAPNRKFVIDFNNNDFGTTGNPYQAQVVFSEANDDIVFQYNDVTVVNAVASEAREATIGIRGTGTAQARQYGFNLGAGAPPVTAGTAIRFRYLDPAFVTVGNASIAEGNSGTTILSFPVTVTNPPATPFSIDYATADGSGTLADNDYVQINTTTLNFAGSQTTSQIDVTINGDVNIEPSETVLLNLSNPQGGVVLGNTVATGTITADDLPGYGSFLGYGIQNTALTANTLNLTTGVTTAGAAHPSVYRGGDFNATGSAYYGVTPAATTWFSVDPLSGARTAMPAITGLPASHTIICLSFNPADGQLWAMTLNTTTFVGTTVGTLDLGTGAYTQVGNFATATGVGFAHDNAGNAYIVDDDTGGGTLRLGTYTAPATFTPIGSMGRTTLAFLEMDFDPETNTLYMPISGDAAPANNGLHSINLATGAVTLIGASSTNGYQNFGVWKPHRPALTVNAAFGTPTPAAGSANSAWDTAINASIPSPVAIGPGEQQVVTGFTGTGSAGSGAGTATSFNLRVPSTLTWNFQQQFDLTLNVNPPGSGTWNTTAGFKNASSLVTLDVTPTGGFVFQSFSGGFTGTTNPDSFTISGPTTITANFVGAAVSDWTLH